MKLNIKLSMKKERSEIFKETAIYEKKRNILRRIKRVKEGAKDKEGRFEKRTITVFPSFW